MKKRVVRAEEFEVVDELGHVRMRIGLSGDEHPFFSMLDADGSVRARFGVQSDGAAGLAIADDNGKVRATFGLSSDGSASSSWTSAPPHWRAVLFTADAMPERWRGTAWVASVTSAGVAAARPTPASTRNGHMVLKLVPGPIPVSSR